MFRRGDIVERIRHNHPEDLQMVIGSCWKISHVAPGLGTLGFEGRGNYGYNQAYYKLRDRQKFYEKRLVV